MRTSKLPQEVTIRASGRKVYLDAECDHEPEVVSTESRPDDFTIKRSYYWSCTKCGKRVAPVVFAEHPVGHIATW